MRWCGQQTPGRQDTSEAILFIYNVEVNDAFPQPLLADCAEGLLDSHVGFQQRLIDTAMSRDGVIEIGKPGDIGHVVRLHRQAGNANSPRRDRPTADRERESDVTTRPQTTDSETQLGASGAFLSREVGIEPGGGFEMRPRLQQICHKRHLGARPRKEMMKKGRD